jgi:hypothetical protein
VFLEVKEYPIQATITAIVLAPTIGVRKFGYFGDVTSPVGLADRVGSSVGCSVAVLLINQGSLST